MRAIDLGLPYAHDVVAAVEASTCSRGCSRAVPVPDTGPGGACEFLAAAFLGDAEVPFRWKGKALICERRRPLPRPARVEVSDLQEALW